MKRGARQAWKGRPLSLIWIVVAGGLILGMTSCALFNKPPVAGFTVGPSTAGTAPYEVTLSAAPSSDPDGDVDDLDYDWDFGDGVQGVGRSVSHTYQNGGTYTIVLTVTDKYDASSRASKTVYVSPPPPPGPSASFTASPASGTSPLTVSFDASASSYDDGVISSYDWNFGDGRTSFGRTTVHTYFSAGSQTFTATLTIRATDGKTATATQQITVNAAGGGGTPASGAPSARFDVLFDDPGPPPVDYTNTTVAPVRVWLDPADSEADEGRTISTYAWSFGDGGAVSTINNTPVSHTYVTSQTSKVFSATLVVIDDEGATDSITKTVSIENYRPIAGFEIYDVLQTNSTTLVAGGTWEADDVTFTGVVAGTTTVWIRSRQLANDADWTGIDMANVDPVPNGKTEAPAGYDDHNFSYDPEGQSWDGGKPSWFPNNAWGLQTLKIDWGDGTIEYEEFKSATEDTVYGHEYAFGGTTLVKTITVTAIDFLGAESTPFSRVVTLNAAAP